MSQYLVNVIAVEIAIIVSLVLANGVFAMAEIAIISCRNSKLRLLAKEGSKRAQAALELSESPNSFLSTVQVGITLVGVLAGAFGGATISRKIAKVLESIPSFAPYGEGIGIAVVVVSITLLSVVLGELTPKRIALNNPLGVALVLARPIQRMSRIIAPVVGLLGALTDAALKMFRIRLEAESAVTEDEVRSLVEQGHLEGVFFKAEKEMITQAMILDRKCVGDIMTPLAQIVWLNVADNDEINRRKIVESGHSYFPVYEGQRSDVLGVVSLKALWANLALDGAASIDGLVVDPLFVSQSMTALKLLETFKRTRMHQALVTDRLGAVQGMVTITDVFEEIVGDIPAFDEAPPDHLADLLGVPGIRNP